MQPPGGGLRPRALALATGYDPESPPLTGYGAAWNAGQASWQGQKRGLIT